MSVVYGPAALNADAALGQNYVSVVRIPKADLAAAGELRITLRGPASGQARFRNIWAGPHDPNGGPCDFDGTQRQITFGGATTLTLGNQESVSDAIGTELRTDRDFLVAYSLLSGDRYRRRAGMASGYRLFYRLGSSGAGETVKQGFAVTNGVTASLLSITTGEAPGEEPEQPAGAATPALGLEQHALSRRLCTAAADVPGEHGMHVHFHLYNPPSSGKRAMLLYAEVTASADTRLLINSHSVAFGGAPMVECNPYFGAGQSIMVPQWRRTASVLGNQHDIKRLRAGTPRHLYPNIILAPGFGTILTVEAQGAGALCTLEWRELPTVPEDA